MGQSPSLEPQLQVKTVNRKELSRLFVQSCSRRFTPIELYTIKQNMKLHDKDENQLINESEFQQMLHFPDNPILVNYIYDLVKRLSQFPLIKHDIDGVTFNGLIKAIVLINEERYTSVLTKNYDHLKLLFICFTTLDEKEFDEDDSFEVLLKDNNVTSWFNTPIVETFDDININELKIPADRLINIISFLLVISRLEPHEPLNVFSKSFENFSKYKPFALPLIRAMNPEITGPTIKQFEISYNEFQAIINTVARNLLKPLSSLLEILLFDFVKEDEHLPKEISETSRLINEFSLSQLSTFLKKEVVYSNIRKLYIGSESGFSMRSFESKAFKWNAPSILIIKGKRIPSNIKNQRYTKFQEEFPNFKNPLLPLQKENDILTYGVYIHQPWRITNKESFGDLQTEIFQLQPIQKIFKSTSIAKNFIYFNTLGGGIGIGNNQPILKNSFKKYLPGNVSLTIDQSLEFAVFRHLGLGGEFKSINEDDWNLEYEDRFLISDVEVWGCGGDKELEEQNKRWEWEQKEAKRRQQINLKSMGEDRALLEMAGLIGQHQSGGSV